jgi:hypothetical protein
VAYRLVSTHRSHESSQQAKALQQQMVSLGQRLRQEIEEEQEAAVTAIEVNRHIDYSRLEDRCKELADRVGVLERSVTSEQEASLQVSLPCSRPYQIASALSCFFFTCL